MEIKRKTIEYAQERCCVIFDDDDHHYDDHYEDIKQAYSIYTYI